MPDLSGRDIQEYLRVLPGIVDFRTIGSINGIKKHNWDQKYRLDAIITINHRISERDIHSLPWEERKHVGREEFVSENHPIIIPAVIRAAAVDHLRIKPSMNIIKFEPFCGVQVQMNVRERRRLP